MSRHFNSSTGNRVVLGNATELIQLATSACSMLAWIFKEVAGGNGLGTYFGKCPSNSRGVRFGDDDSTGTDAVTFGSHSATPTAPLRITNNNFITKNKWTGVCATFNGTVNASGINIWKLDGGVLSEATSYQTSTNGTTALVADASVNAIIGNINTQVRSFGGYLAFVQVWLGRVISKAEMVQAFYVPGSVRANLMGFWPLLGGTNEPDWAGRNNGTVTTAGSASSPIGPPIRSLFLPRGFSRHSYVVPAAAPVAAPVSAVQRRVSRNLMGVGL